jgi:predicted DNA-binding transcriptional regulator
MVEEDLWKKFCNFFEEKFSSQLETHFQSISNYFTKWKNTKMAYMLCSKVGKKQFESFSEIPLTEYQDYPILHEFGKKLENLVAKTPRKKRELFIDYYRRLMAQISPMLDGWLTDTFSFAAKTSGTFGESKWIVHGETFWKNFVDATIAMAALSCSDCWGETKLKRGDRALNALAPVPYISGYGVVAGLPYFKAVPPLEVTDNITDFRRKLSITLKGIEKAGGIDFGAGVPSFFYLAAVYFENPEKFYYDYYKSLKPGIMKLFLLFKHIESKMSGRRKPIKELMPLKGFIIGGADTTLYTPLLKKIFDIDPLNAYGSTELGPVMMGPPDNKSLLMPCINYCYMEFLDENGNIKQINELKKDKIYELIATPYGSTLFRYKTGDLFKVVSFRDDGLPYFIFESRRVTQINIYGYFELTEFMVAEALRRTGLQISDKWAVAKTIEPTERISFLMEKEWVYSEEEAEKRIYDALYEISEDFRHFVRDFKIKKPSEIIEVEYLQKGAFIRYFLKRAKEGVSLGQIKPPKIIPTNRMDIYETLRRI